MKTKYHQFHEAKTDMAEESSVAIQPRRAEASAIHGHKTLRRMEQDGKALLLVSLVVGLVLWLGSVVTWLFTPPDQEIDY